MCVTMSPAELSNTIVYAGLCEDGDHLLGYQNKAQNLDPRAKSNVMILPIPSCEELGPENVFDLSKDKNILKNMKDVLDPVFLLRGFSRSMTKGGSFNIFKSGNYQVLTASDALTAQNVLHSAFKEPPPFSLDVARAYAEWYNPAQWKMLFAVWEGQDEMESDPILIKYKSSDPKHLFMPGLDAHNGKRPNLRNSVRRDHVLIVGHESGRYKRSEIETIHNSAVASFLPNHFSGFKMREQEVNCDWLVSTQALNESRLMIKRHIPDYFEFKG